MSKNEKYISFKNNYFIYKKIRNVDNKEIYDEMSQKELQDFVEQMTTEQFEGVQSFFDTMPKLRHTIEVKNPNTGVVNEVALEGMQSFLG